MKAIWLGLVIYAVVEAIAAARRVWQKHQHLGRSQAEFQTGWELNQPSAQSLAATSQAEQRQAGRSGSTEGQRRSKPSSKPVALPTSLLAEPELLQQTADLDLPLAVSVSVTDLDQSERPVTTSTIDLDLIPPELALPELESAKSDRHPASDQEHSSHQSVLAEIAELGQTATDAVQHFQRYLDHPDDVVRAATVFELGELAVKRSGAEANEILDLLAPLSQDPAPQVRSQVVVALAKIQSAIS